MGVRAPGHRSWYQRHLPGFLLWLPGKVQLVRSEAVTIHLTEVGRDADMDAPRRRHLRHQLRGARVARRAVAMEAAPTDRLGQRGRSPLDLIAKVGEPFLANLRSPRPATEYTAEGAARSGAKERR